MLPELVALYGSHNIQLIGNDVYLLVAAYNGTDWIPRGAAIWLGKSDSLDLVDASRRTNE